MPVWTAHARRPASLLGRRDSLARRPYRSIYNGVVCARSQSGAVVASTFRVWRNVSATTSSWLIAHGALDVGRVAALTATGFQQAPYLDNREHGVE